MILGFLLLLAPACSDDQDDGFVPAPGPGETGSRDEGVIDRIDGDDGYTSTRTEILDSTRPFVEKGALRDLTNPNSKLFNRAVKAVMGMMAFHLPWEETGPASFDPSTVKAVREAFLRAYRRGRDKGKRQCVSDIEIFLVFQAAFRSMPPDERDTLFERWRKEKGEAEPPKLATGSYPLFWLREDPVLWSVGRGSWWWTYHALRDDPAFSYSREDGAFFTTPSGTVFTSWRAE